MPAKQLLTDVANALDRRFSDAFPTRQYVMSREELEFWRVEVVVVPAPGAKTDLPGVLMDILTGHFLNQQTL